eukprot:TRINITY_DN25195_c0_g1_i1.p1 TRINITY_DN25195_c0_g1~~TRINITY_DN25195_c0_g1_i1.p1  ORF type:complete len:615 (+),score=92.41 TRINITY_DN25195_c0_g1_i1:206-1846(+)
MTYNIINGSIETSDLGEDRVNSIIREWASVIRENTSESEIPFYRELGAKVSRKGTCLLKIILRIPDDRVDDFIKKNVTPIIEIMSTRHVIDCAFLQHSNGKSKPSKNDTYILVKGKHLIEQTPAPYSDPYIISPDTFAEVNHDAEDRLWVFLSDYLTRLFKTETAASLDLLLMGRDTNASFVSLYPTFPFVNCFGLSHCPKVAADMELNKTFAASQKVKNGIPDPTIEITYVKGKFQYASTMSSFSSKSDKVCLVNAGRGGMADGTVLTVIGNPQINKIIYVSCNQQTAYQDVDIMLTQGRFYIDDYRYFNFQAGTEYVMQVFCLCRTKRGDHRVLIQPVGPPGSGKSSLSKGLSETISCVTHIERDVIYKNKKDSGLSMKASKKQTHTAISDSLTSCETDCCVYDSTSGALEGRQHVNNAFFTPSTTSMNALAVTVYFTSVDVPWLLNNCTNRVGHPGFPDTPEAGSQKISNVLLSIEPPSAADALPASVSGLIVRVCPKSIAPKDVLLRIASVALMSPRLAEKVFVSTSEMELQWVLVENIAKK